MMVLLSDAHALRYCNIGQRAFFERYALDWSEFVKNGLPEEAFAHIDDEMVRAVIAEAKRRTQEETNGRQ